LSGRTVREAGPPAANRHGAPNPFVRQYFRFDAHRQARKRRSIQGCGPPGFAPASGLSLRRPGSGLGASAVQDVADRVLPALEAAEQAWLEPEPAFQAEQSHRKQPQTVRRRYVKDGSGATGQDRGRVDRVRFAAGPPPPATYTQPADLTVVIRAPAAFSGTAVGPAPFSDAWLRVGAFIAGLADTTRRAGTNAPGSAPPFRRLPVEPGPARACLAIPFS